MTDIAFVAGLGLLLAACLAWAFRALPGEQWQILAAVPLTKQESGAWRGLNLTYYGFFTANAYTLGVAVLLVLMSSISIPPEATLILTAAVLAVCIPASRIVAVLVEGKRYTFTVGGAFFVGVLVTPGALWLVNQLVGTRWGFDIPLLPALAAIGISYAFGEGLGRLACISFGCCYGRPVCDCHPLVQRLFSAHHFVFSGPTKKASYEGGHEGRALVPVQAITAVLFVVVGLASVLLFLRGWYGTALLLSIGVTQIWRLLSEFLRADNRGVFRFLSAYQVMALLAVGLAAGLVWWHGAAEPQPTDIIAGLRALWAPAIILFLQGLWLLTFLWSGRSQVTGSKLCFEVLRDRV